MGTRKNPKNARGQEMILENIACLRDGAVPELGFLRVPKFLKTPTAEIDKQAWDRLNSAVLRSFPKPDSGRIAVKAVNHLGDEVMKIFDV